jgi:hypothetical protein
MHACMHTETHTSVGVSLSLGERGYVQNYIEGVHLTPRRQVAWGSQIANVEATQRLTVSQKSRDKS